MPLSFRQAGNTFIQGPNISIYPSGNSYAISGSAPSTGGGFTGLTSAGTGQYLVASPITSNDLIYKSLSGASNISINDNDNGTLTFSIAGAGTGTIISGVNVGTNANSIGFFTGLSTTINANDTLAFRNITGGPNINVTLSTANDGDILISRGSPTLVNQISPIGTGTQPVGVGARFLSSITATNLMVARTLLGTSGFSQTIVNNPNVTGATSAITASTVVNIGLTNTNASRLRISNATSNFITDSNFQIDTTTGSLGIGNPAIINNSRLIFPATTANISQIRLTAFSTEPTNPSDGDIWYSTSGDTLKFEKGTVATDFIFKDNNISLSEANLPVNRVLLVDSGGTLTTIYKPFNKSIYINSFGIFNALSSVTIQDTASEISIISSVLTGSTTLLASTNSYNPELAVGRKYRFNAKGTIQTDNSSVDTLEVKIKLGAFTIGTTSAYTVHQNIPANTYFEIDATFTIRNSGIVSCNGKIFGTHYITRSPNMNLKGIYDQRQTVTTTTNQVFDCTVKFDQADANNIITITESTLEILN